MSKSAEKDARAIRSGQITRACLDNGMSMPDACETAAVLLPLLDAMLADAWDEGYEAHSNDYWDGTGGPNPHEVIPPELNQPSKGEQ